MHVHAYIYRICEDYKIRCVRYLFLRGTDVMGFLYDMLRSKLNPASAKPSQTTQCHLRPQNLSCYVSKRARLFQKKIEPS